MQYDDNNLPYAVIKVRTENINDKQRRQLLFSGNAATFIELEYKDGEVWVYLTAKYADYLKISHPDFSSTEFYLPYDLKPKCGYEMVLVNKSVFVEMPANLPTNQTVEKKEVKNGKQVIHYADGSVYEGYILNEEPHGKGVLTLANGNVYEGIFVNGQITGRGKYTWSDGDVYEGDFVNGQMNGKGKCAWADGTVYDGDWKDGERTGKGVYKWSNGCIYEGDFVNGQMTGKGKCSMPDGSFYEGDWIDGIREGYGIMQYTDGVYEGEWGNDMRSGQGRFTSSDGNVKEGEWKDDKLVDKNTIWYILITIVSIAVIIKVAFD